MPFDAWSFVIDVMVRGSQLEQRAILEEWGLDFLMNRMADAARELADKLKPHLRAQQ